MHCFSLSRRVMAQLGSVVGSIFANQVVMLNDRFWRAEQTAYSIRLSWTNIGTAPLPGVALYWAPVK